MFVCCQMRHDAISEGAGEVVGQDTYGKDCASVGKTEVGAEKRDKVEKSDDVEKRDEVEKRDKVERSEAAMELMADSESQHSNSLNDKDVEQ